MLCASRLEVCTAPWELEVCARHPGAQGTLPPAVQAGFKILLLLGSFVKFSFLFFLILGFALTKSLNSPPGKLLENEWNFLMGKNDKNQGIQAQSNKLAT